MSSDAGYEVERVHFSLDVNLDGKICDIFPNEEDLCAQSEFAISLTLRHDLDTHFLASSVPA